MTEGECLNESMEDMQENLPAKITFPGQNGLECYFSELKWLF